MDLLFKGDFWSLSQSLQFYYFCYKNQGRKHPLSMESLKGMRRELQGYEKHTKNLIECFDIVLKNFDQEPSCVKENATLMIQSTGVELEFSNGNQKCFICVDDTHGDPEYCVFELSGDVYLARLCNKPQLLSIKNLQRVKEGLEKWQVGEELRACLKLALKDFAKEPISVQENARLVIRKYKYQLEFISGKGKGMCEISINFDKKKPHYHIEVKNWEMYRERLPLHKKHLSIKNLERIRQKVRRLQGTPPEVLKNLNIALNRFCKEPGHVRHNARMVIEVKGGEIELISGKGENAIDVTCFAGEVCYQCNYQVAEHARESPNQDFSN